MGTLVATKSVLSASASPVSGPLLVLGVHRNLGHVIVRAWRTVVANVLIGVTVVEQVRIARNGNPIMRRCLRGDTRGAL